MKNMEREKFEESWKNAFENAEVTPSEKVWVNVELELEKAKAGHLRRRLMFYQMLAAASVVFAMAVAGAGFYYNFNHSDPVAGNLAFQKNNASPQAAPKQEVPMDNATSETALSERERSNSRNLAVNPSDNQKQNTSGTGHVTDQPASLQAANIQTRNKQDRDDGDRADTGSNGIKTVVGNTDRYASELPVAINDRDLAPLFARRKIELNMRPKEKEVDPAVAMMARLERRENEMQGEEKNRKDEGTLSEKLWTSIGFAAGSFNTMQSSASGSALSTSAMTFAAPIVDQETKASGYAYSMGLNVGTKLSDRWVLQGGVNYLTHSSDYTANNVVVTSAGTQQQRFRAATTNEIIHSNAQDLNNKILFSAPYNVNNSLRYLSIPMQAGYLLVNKTFGLQLNAGVATDLFLQNTVTPDSENLDKTTQPGGADSPYRTVNLSGLFGTEFSYRFGERYRVSLNPGIRYPLSTIYKSELGVQASPLTFDVGLRFRYIFH